MGTKAIPPKSPGGEDQAMLTIPQAAGRLGLSRERMDQWVREHRITVIRRPGLARRLRIPGSEINRILGIPLPSSPPKPKLLAAASLRMTELAKRTRRRA